MHPDWINELSAFVAMETVAGNHKANEAARVYLREKLEALGFTVQIKGQSTTGQPLMLARHQVSDAPTLVLYNHYDVEQIHLAEEWDSPPFCLTERDGRLYGRGIADNKAVLLARLSVLKTRIAAGIPLPNILWIIQGEEEVGAAVAHALLPDELRDLNSLICLEETGYHRDGVPLMFHLYGDAIPKAQADTLTASVNDAVFDGRARTENRGLRKFGSCPFINNLPAASHYIGFGPNDYDARIHQDNESMDKVLLADYVMRFDHFIQWLQGVTGQAA